VIVALTGGADIVPFGGFYVGAGAGVAVTEAGTSTIHGSGFLTFTTCDDKSPHYGFAYLAKAGYDFHVTRRVAVGPFIYFFGGPTVPGVERASPWNVLSIGVMGVFKLGSKQAEKGRSSNR
jgi:hypothetical protein